MGPSHYLILLSDSVNVSFEKGHWHVESNQCLKTINQDPRRFGLASHLRVKRGVIYPVHTRTKQNKNYFFYALLPSYNALWGRKGASRKVKGTPNPRRPPDHKIRWPTKEKAYRNCPAWNTKNYLQGTFCCLSTRESLPFFSYRDFSRLEWDEILKN